MVSSGSEPYRDSIGSTNLFAEALREVDSTEVVAGEGSLESSAPEDAATPAPAAETSSSPAFGSGGAASSGQIDWTSWLKQRMSCATHCAVQLLRCCMSYQLVVLLVLLPEGVEIAHSCGLMCSGAG